MNKTIERKFVVYRSETKEFWVYRDKSDVALKIGVTRNTVINRLKKGSFEKNGYVIGIADDIHSKRGSGNIDNLKRRPKIID